MGMTPKEGIIVAVTTAKITTLMKSKHKKFLRNFCGIILYIFLKYQYNPIYNSLSGNDLHLTHKKQLS